MSGENYPSTTFPFATCERPNENGIVQPYSTLFNVINCLIIFYFLLKTRHTYTFILLFCILCFEIVHVFSHILHIRGAIQANIIHTISYFINLAFFNTFYCYTNTFPRYEFIIYLFILVCFDIYSVFNLDFIYYIITQSIILISMLLYYYPLLPKSIQSSVYQISFLMVIIILLFFNEKYNCEKMMNIYPHFPYHIFIEVFGILLFYILCSNFYKL